MSDSIGFCPQYAKQYVITSNSWQPLGAVIQSFYLRSQHFQMCSQSNSHLLRRYTNTVREGGHQRDWYVSFDVCWGGVSQRQNAASNSQSTGRTSGQHWIRCCGCASGKHFGFQDNVTQYQEPQQMRKQSVTWDLHIEISYLQHPSLYFPMGRKTERGDPIAMSWAQVGVSAPGDPKYHQPRLRGRI